MTTIGADGGQQESRLSVDDPNDTSGTTPGGGHDPYRGLTLTSGGGGDDADDDDDELDDDDEETDDDDDDDDEDDGNDGLSESNPA